MAKEARLAVLMLGSLSKNLEDPLWPQRTDGEFYSHPDLGFPGAQQPLLDEVLNTGVPTILILSGGQAFVLTNSTLRANAIMHSFLGGEFTGDALTEILFGKVNPSGKLTITMPEDSGAWPIAYGYLNSDNFGGPGGFSAGSVPSDWQFPVLGRNPPMPFGFGLSYTTFNISAPTVTTFHDSFEISATISNAGVRTGKELVQLYLRQHYTHIVETPNKALIRFTKVELVGGESKTVVFIVSKSELGNYMNMKWRVDRGDYSFFVGSSSNAEDLKVVNLTIA